MKRAYQIAGAVLLAFSVWVVWESTQLQYYTPIGPGPGFFPLWIGLLLGTLSAALIWQGTTGGHGPLPPDFFPGRAGALQFGACVLALAVSAAVIEPLGFRLTMLAFYLFLLPALGCRRPVLTVAIALAGSFGAYQVFDRMLYVPLPTGPFGL